MRYLSKLPMKRQSQYMLSSQAMSVDARSQAHCVRFREGEVTDGHSSITNCKTVEDLPSFRKLKKGFFGSRLTSISAANFIASVDTPNLVSKNTSTAAK